MHLIRATHDKRFVSRAGGSMELGALAINWFNEEIVIPEEKLSSKPIFETDQINIPTDYTEVSEPVFLASKEMVDIIQRFNYSKDVQIIPAAIFHSQTMTYFDRFIINIIHTSKVVDTKKSKLSKLSGSIVIDYESIYLNNLHYLIVKDPTLSYQFAINDDLALALNESGLHGFEIVNQENYKSRLSYIY